MPTFIAFIVTAPECNAGMMPQTLHLLCCFHPYILPKGIAARHHAAGEHEILPDQDSVAVTVIVEDVGQVHTTTPYTEHVHTRLLGLQDQSMINGIVDAAHKHIGRYQVCPSGEDILAIDPEAEGLPVRVLFLNEFQRAETGGACDRRSASGQATSERV